jgi:hypothetical protein
MDYIQKNAALQAELGKIEAERRSAEDGWKTRTDEINTEITKTSDSIATMREAIEI